MKTKMGLRRGFTLVELVIVLVIISALTVLLAGLLKDIPLLRNSEDEAEMLLKAYVFSKKAAIKSNQTVYFEFDLDEQNWSAFRIDRSGKEPVKNYLLDKHTLSSSSIIVYLRSRGSEKQERGKLTLSLLPGGEGEELAVALGDGLIVKKTVHLPRYGYDVKIVDGEIEIILDNPAWKETLEQL
jgi:prepilin-type N-terminal cleavage/methylation domain-containing protein